MGEWRDQDESAVLTPSARLREGCGFGSGGCGSSGSGSTKPGKKGPAKKTPAKKEQEKETTSSSEAYAKWEGYLLKKVMSEIEDWMVDFAEKSGNIDLEESEIEEILIKTRRKLKQAL